MKLFIPAITLNRSAPATLARQLHAQLEATLRRGDPPPVSRLPSTRAFSKMLGVSRNTVAAAYEELVADGLLEAVRGSGMRVKARKGAAKEDAAGTPRRKSVRAILRDAHYPEAPLSLADPDGNGLYLNPS